VERFLPFAQENIGPAIRVGKRVLLVAHGNTLRGLVKYAERMPDQDIADLNIPTGMPMVYELEDDMKPIRRYYLSDPEKAKKAMAAVASQGKVL
jgi:2,3-bisphosphoglycerate-dependent phosphoglycerate mutase